MPANSRTKSSVEDVWKDEWPWGELEDGCPYVKAYKETVDALSSDVMLAHPDLHDPLAEYVIMTDAFDVAAGVVLMQWQRGPMHKNEEQKKRMARGGFS
eukprot:4019351-Pleurochrysis_carterae.AAC.1